jgi:anti-sigma factor ChrR (cupin superfamily)
MTCPKPEVLSQWADGSLDPREALVVGRHAETCPACARKASELKAVGAWIQSAGVAGASCLTADEMAVVLEGGRVPAHVRTCPRCASEFRALRPAERKATRRRHKQPAPMTAWAAAAAIFIAVGILLVVANQQTRPVEKEQVRIPTPPQKVELPKPQPPVVPPTQPKPPVKDEPLKPNPLLKEPPVVPPVQPPTPVEAPVKPPTSDPAQPPPVKTPPPTTVVATAPPVYASLNVRSGGLSSLADGKWVKAAKIEEGAAIRADGRTQIEFAQAKITLDASSRFTLTKNELALTDGAMSAEVSPGSKFTLVLDEQRIIPQAFSTRVMFCARPDRVVVEEGSAKVKDAVLGEGVEHLVKKDKVEAQKRRTLPAAARARETLVRNWDLVQQASVQLHVTGSVQRDGERRMLVSEPSSDGIFYGKAGYGHGEAEPPLFVVKPNTAVRFRYYMTQPGHLEFVLKNITKDENFNKVLEPVVKQSTTVTLFVRDILPNAGGKKVTCDAGDVYLGATWFVGKPGSPTEIYIDQFQILEIDR